VSISDPEEAQAFVDGVNQGLASFAEMERVAGIVAEALQAVSLAMTTSGMMRATVAPPAGGPPRLVLVRGGGAPAGPGAGPAAPAPVAGPPPAPARLAAGGGARPVAVGAQPATARAPAPAAAPRQSPAKLVHSQPASAIKPEPAKVPVRAPVPVAPPAPAPAAEPDRERRSRPPFVLRLPREKDPHFALYSALVRQRALVSEFPFRRGRTDQADVWDDNLAVGGAHGMSPRTFERGRALGLSRRDILRPRWTHLNNSVPTDVDHIIELQVTPQAMRAVYDAFENYELLDQSSNSSAGARLEGNIAAERAKQAAFDPAAATATLTFDQVELDGGSAAERWTSDEIQKGEHLDVFEGKK
jgi:hypothetical protein